MWRSDPVISKTFGSMIRESRCGSGPVISKTFGSMVRESRCGVVVQSYQRYLAVL